MPLSKASLVAKAFNEGFVVSATTTYVYVPVIYWMILTCTDYTGHLIDGVIIMVRDR